MSACIRNYFLVLDCLLQKKFVINFYVLVSSTCAFFVKTVFNFGHAYAIVIINKGEKLFLMWIFEYPFFFF